jgi:hypothetical protein
MKKPHKEVTKTPTKGKKSTEQSGATDPKAGPALNQGTRPKAGDKNGMSTTGFIYS